MVSSSCNRYPNELLDDTEVVADPGKLVPLCLSVFLAVFSELHVRVPGALSIQAIARSVGLHDLEME